MNGQHVDREFDQEWVPTRGDLHRASRGRRTADRIVCWTIAMIMLALFGLAFSCSEAEARQRFVQQQTSRCVGNLCAIKQQAVVVHHAQPVVHAAPVVVEKVVQQAYVPPVQNFFYSVGQPVVQQSQMAAAVKDAMAELQFNAQVNGTISGSVTGGAQGVYQPQYQQPAPQWTPPPQPQQPPADPQPPATPPQFSMTAPSAAQQECGACHGSGKAKGGFSLENMTGEQLWSAIDRIKDNSMPPKGGLSDAAKEAVAKELLARQP